MSNDVRWVNNTLSMGQFNNFIKKYLKEYDKILISKTPDIPRRGRNEAGLYFINFMDTCKKNLVSNPRYYHYNKVNNTCDPMEGPTLIYSLLLKHIVHNVKKYNKPDSDKIRQLLLWFEEWSITQLVMIPLDKYCKKIFEENNVGPGYTMQQDGTLGYCSRIGIPVETGGMEISNTRVHELLKAVHGNTDSDDDDDDVDGGGDDVGGHVDGGKKRQIHKSRTHRTRRTRRRLSSKYRTRHHRTRTRRN
jgi:hypothetical protein